MYDQEQKVDSGMSIGRILIAVIIGWILVGVFFGAPSDTRTYTIYLKEPMRVDMALQDKEVTMVNADKYLWTNYGATLQIEMLGRTILIPVTSIKFIEVWNQNSTSQGSR